jgi:hypothetical protein
MGEVSVKTHKRLSSILSVSVFLIGINAAFAFDHDPALYRLCLDQVGGKAESPCLGPAANSVVTADTESFKAISKEYGMALAPALLSPAESLGMNGFLVDLEFSITTVDNQAAHWKNGEAIEDGTPPSAFVVSRIGVRKGLFGGLEAGMNTAYLIESELWAFGGYLKWALHEGMATVPLDFGVRGSYTQVVGSTQLQMALVGLDVILSKSFGVGGVVNIAPYMAYSPLWVISSSEVLDSSPGEIGDSPRADFVFNDETQIIHRFTIGSRFVMGLFNLTPEVSLTTGQQTYAVKLGADF